MLNENFAHLHVHNEYSLLDGVGTAEEYAAQASKLGFKYLALTNHGNIDGLIKFQRACERHNINPVLGCELYLVGGEHLNKGKGDVRHHCVVLVKESRGWSALCKMLNIANVEGFYHRPRLSMKVFSRLFNSGLVLLSGCGQTVLRLDEGFEMYSQLYQEYPDNVFIEVMPHNIPIQRECAEITDAFIKRHPDIGVVATNDCHYINEGDSLIQEVLLAISRKAKWEDPNRFKFNFTGLHIRTADEMVEGFKKQNVYRRELWLNGMRETVRLAKMCSKFRVKKREISLPKLRHPNETLERLVKGALRGMLKGGVINEIELDVYRERAEEELALITKKEFSLYFLIVADLLDTCREEGIMVGPGRGSVGGSLVAYLIGITSIDPIKYGLLFSRFINEGRLDYPDIDIDFEDRHRERVIAILKGKYGEDHIAPLSTFLRMKGRMVIRDVARVFDLPGGEVDFFAKSIWGEDNEKLLGGEKGKSPGKEFANKYPQAYDIAEKLELQVKGTGKHAAAIIISGEDLNTIDRGHLAMRRDNLSINWEKDDAEYMGLMKLDILALNTLTVLKETAKAIEDNHGRVVNFNTLKPENKGVFSYLSKGELTGIFQLTGKASADITRRMGVREFEDIAVIISISRPGPADSGATEDYLTRREGYSKGVMWPLKNEIYEAITKETYGIIIYQEQVMQVISKVAGLPYSTADQIRKVIGKKRDKREFKPFWNAFLNGCLKHKTMTQLEAANFWKMLEHHSRYSFNKSHAIEYAMIAYWTAWAKLYYPTEFICASLTYGQEKDKEGLILDAYNMGQQVITPKVGLSDPIKWKAVNGKLYCPFIEIKGVGEKGAYECGKKAKAGQQLGFFSRGELSKVATPNTQASLPMILHNIDAYNEDSIPEGVQHYFNFPLKGGK